MIASLVLTGEYNIGLNANNKLKVDDHLLLITDVPFVRYRFKKYTEKQLRYIVLTMKKFPSSAHLVEFTLSDDTPNELALFENSDYGTKIARFVYVPVTDEDIANELLSEKIERLKNIKEYFFDRVMIKDDSTMLYGLAADRIKHQIEKILDTDIKARDIGVCSSPLSFKNADVEGQACLTAVWARKLIADYVEVASESIPTASHECMTCCGCIK